MSVIKGIQKTEVILKEVAPMLWNYKTELEKQGFTEKQAFDLVRDYHKTMFNQIEK